MTQQSQRIVKQRYNVIRQVGKGGFGSVLLAQDTQAQDRFVALKEMELAHLPVKEREEATNRFLREALLLASLEHENLPRIYNHFIEQDILYLVMDFIWGKSLEDDIHEGATAQPIQQNRTRQYSLTDLFPIVLQICPVLEYLHTRQPAVIFRDLKPSNIMLTAQGHVYLIDFGIARHFQPGKLKDTAALGSPGYAAPEQYGKAQTTPKADVYSFGVLLHHLLTGIDPSEHPFFFDRLVDLVPTVPAELSALVERMLDMDEQKRPYVGEVYQELLKIQNISAADVHAGASPQHVVRFPQTSVDLQRIGWRNGGSAWSHPCRIRAIAWSPDNRIIATGGDDGMVRLWDTTGHLRDMYLCQKEGVFALEWAPDGNRFAAGGATSVGDDGRIKIWKLATGITGNSLVLHGHVQDVLVLSWSPDGKFIASGCLDRTSQVWQVSNGSSLVTRGDQVGEGGTPVNVLSWSPDGKLIATNGRCANTFLGGMHAFIDVWEADTGKSRTVFTDHSGLVDDLAWAPDGSRIASTGKGTRHVYVWNPVGGNALLTCLGGTRGKRHLCWIGVDRLSSVEQNGEVIVWNAYTGEILSTFHAFSATAGIAAWSKDCTMLASVGLNERTLQLWTRSI